MIESVRNRIPLAWFGLLVALGVAPLACTGTAGSMDGSEMSANGDGKEGQSEATPSAASASSPGSGVQFDGTSKLHCADPSPATPVYLRRLTKVEYQHSVVDLLGESPDAVAGLISMLQDPRSDNLDNNAAGETLNGQLVQMFKTAAETLVPNLIQSDRRSTILGCTPQPGDSSACLRPLIERVGRRVYRRPLTDVEIANFLGLAQRVPTEAGPNEGITRVLEVLFQSPHFLFRVEIGNPDPDHPDRLILSGFEVLTRLSFFLWGSTPTDALLDKAQAGMLDTPDGVERVAREMLADPKARAGMNHFYSQWLALDQLQTLTPQDRDTAQFPAWNAELPGAMVKETSLLLDDTIWRDKGNFLDILIARYSFVNKGLATLYGLPTPAHDWDRVDFPADVPRMGLLTQGSYLTETSFNNRSSTTKRGLWVRQSLLCDVVPPPPPNVSTTPPVPQPGESERETFAAHTASAACATCHKRMDPIGFATDQFNAIGAFRTKDATGHAIASDGDLTMIENGQETHTPLHNALDLGNVLHAMPQVPACITKEVFRYAFGRTEAQDDQCALQSFYNDFQQAGYNLPALLITIVRSDAFRTRATQASAEIGATP